MSDFTGRLSIISNQSSLDNDLLLMAGIPDAAQAIFAATQFLVKTKHLSSGQRIIVTGERGTFGDAGIIVMTNAAADPTQPFAVPLAASAALLSESLSTEAELASPATKKDARGKSAKGSGKSRSKTKASGRGAGRRRVPRSSKK